MALVAPRALLVLGNPDYEWLADESGYVSSVAAKKVWDAFDIGDRFGYSIVGGHPHCGLPDQQRPEVEAFVDRFLRGDTEAATDDVATHPFAGVDAGRWTAWWGTDEPAFPDVVVDTADVESVFLEAECGRRGGAWDLIRDADASNGAYVTVRAGQNSTDAAPAGQQASVSIPFSTTRDGRYYLFGRVDGPSADDDSIYVAFDDGGRTIQDIIEGDIRSWYQFTVQEWLHTNDALFECFSRIQL